jgi:hypothetical protein
MLILQESIAGLTMSPLGSSVLCKIIYSLYMLFLIL